MKEFFTLFFTDSDHFAKHFFGVFMTFIILASVVFLFAGLILTAVGVIE